MSRRIELVSGIACLVLAVLAALYALFGPTISVSTSESVVVQRTTDAETAAREPVVTTTEHRSLYDDGIEAGAIVYIILMIALSLAVVVLAFAHGRLSAMGAVAPLWVAGAVMLFLALIAGFSIGLFFLPAGLAAIVAAVAGTMRTGQLRRNAA